MLRPADHFECTVEVTPLRLRLRLNSNYVMALLAGPVPDEQGTGRCTHSGGLPCVAGGSCCGEGGVWEQRPAGPAPGPGQLHICSSCS